MTVALRCIKNSHDTDGYSLFKLIQHMLDDEVSWAGIVTPHYLCDVTQSLFFKVHNR